MEFDKFADHYEDIHDENVKISGEGSTYFTWYKAHYLSSQLPSDYSGKILDYGCGIGRLLRYIQEIFPRARLSGFDPSHESIQKAKRTLSPGVVLVNSKKDLERNYDLIVMANVLHHVNPLERAELIAELSSRLNVGGKIYFFEHNPLNPLTRWVVGQCEFDKDAVLLYSGEIIRYLKASKMEIHRRHYIMFFPKILSGLRFLEKALTWLPAGAQYVIVAEKKI